MFSLLRPLVSMALTVVVAVSFAGAETPAPTADDVKALREKFQAEREQAVKAQFPADALVRADDLVKRAEDAEKAKNYKAALRHLRDARWQLPYLPPGLPEHVTRVLGESRMRHADRVNALAYSPDGLFVASASRDGTVKVWDIGTGREVVTYRGHIDQPDDPTKGGSNPLYVTDVAFHPKEKVIASSAGNQVHTWDPTTGKIIKTVVNLGKMADKPIKALAYSPDGKLLAVGADDGILRVVESETGNAVFTSPSRNARIERVVFSPNGKLVALGDSNSQVAVYIPEAKGNQLALSVQGIDLGEVMGVGFTADGASVFACGRDGKTRLTAGPNADGSSAPNTATKLRDYNGHSGAVTGLAVSADGQFLITCGEDRTVRVWDVKSGKQLRSFQGHMTKATAVAVRGDGRQVASGSEDGAVRVWDLNAADEHRALTESKESLWAVALSPDGKRLAAAGADKKIRVYDPETGALQATLDATAATTALAFLPDNNRLVAAGGDKVAKVWDVADKKVVQELPNQAGFRLTDHVFEALRTKNLPESVLSKLKTLKDKELRQKDFEREVTKLLGADEKDKFLKLILDHAQAHTLAVLALAVSADGKFVVSGSADATVRGFDPDGGKELWTWATRKAACAVAIRKGNKQLAVGSADGTLAIVDIGGVAPKELSSQAAHTAGVAGVAFSPDGSRLASVGGDGAVRVWTVADAGTIAQLVKFDGQVAPGGTGFAPLSTVSFSPDGRFVAAAGADSVIRVWDVQTKSEARGLRGHTDWVTSVCFSPDGRLLASVAAEKDNSLRIFELPALDTGGAAGGHAKAVNAAAVSPNGQLIATASTDDTIKIWDIKTGKEVATLIGNADVPYALAFLGNDAVVMGGALPTNDTGRLHFWGITPPRLNKSVPTGSVYTIVPATDNTKLGAWTGRPAVGDMVKNHSYDVYTAKGELVLSVPDKGRDVVAATFTPDLAWAIGGDKSGTVRVWDLAKKERLGGDWPLFASSFADLGVTPDKKYLVAADDQGTIKVAEIADRSVVASGKAHKSGVRALVVSPTGTTFFTISNDRELKAWSLTDLKELKEVRSWVVPVTVNGAAYSPDGKSVVTANADGTAFVLELP